ncbi:hypothetical protein C8R46DRAFT_1083546 [Mycena filopes]|nr:hypothetical protein C8R46DRAFT_1083546 [Mycena filopes]
MHSAGIYHNDLVPRNIVQDSEGELRIIDFHIAELDHRCRGEDKCEELVAFRAADLIFPSVPCPIAVRNLS